jgi:hypothetical protein
MKKKLKLKKGVKLGIFIVLCIYFLVCLFLYIKIDLETKREIQTIRNEYNAHISEIMPDETNYTQEEQTFVYEPKNEVKNDVERLSEQYEVEYELVEAIIRHETGHRTSRAFKEDNNSCGNMVWSQEKQKMVFLKFDTEEEGIEYCIKNLKRNYFDKGLDTIEKIQPKYAPIGTNDNGLNQYWVSGVTKIYNDLKGE